MTRTTIPNFKLFIVNLLTVFKTMSGFPFSNIYPEFKTLSRFRENPHFPIFEYNPQFKTKFTFITYIEITENKNCVMKAKLNSKLLLNPSSRILSVKLVKIDDLF